MTVNCKITNNKVSKEVRFMSLVKPLKSLIRDTLLEVVPDWGSRKTFMTSAQTYRKGGGRGRPIKDE